MDRSKIEEFVNIIENNKKVSFYLYNVRYTIIKNSNGFLIKQVGINRTYSYSKLTDLFSEYRIYGLSLVECFEDIKIIED